MSLTVAELIEQLENFPQDLPVVMSHDSEGNGFSPEIEAEEDNGKVVILWPSYFSKLDEAVENYTYAEE